MWVWVSSITSLLNPHDMIFTRIFQTYPLFYFFTVHTEICRSAALYGGISSGFAYISYTNILLPSINLLPQTPTFVRPGLCQTTMFQELLEAVSNLGCWKLAKETAYDNGFVEDLRPSNLRDTRWCMMIHEIPPNLRVSDSFSLLAGLLDLCSGGPNQQCLLCIKI